MKVLFNSLGFYDGVGGVGTYLDCLVRHLACDVEIAVAREGRSLDSFFGGKSFRGRGFLFRILSPIVRSREWMNERKLAARIDEGDFDVLHLAGAHEWGKAWRGAVGKKPIVVTVHDLIPEIFNMPMLESRMRRHVLSAATVIIAISENTKRDLMRLYGVPEDKIAVVYHGAPAMAAFDAMDDATNAVRPYVVFVGKRDGYKNWRWLVEAMAGRLRDGLRLVCTWREFDEGERAFLKSLGVERNVTARSCSRDEIWELYRHALALAFPSRYEGFGLPILEAWASGCPVILSRASCFPEVGGGAALYFGLDDADALSRCLDEVGEEGRRKDLVARGRQRVGLFTWEKTAEKTLAAYEKAIRLFSHANRRGAK